MSSDESFLDTPSNLIFQSISFAKPLIWVIRFEQFSIAISVSSRLEKDGRSNFRHRGSYSCFKWLTGFVSAALIV